MRVLIIGCGDIGRRVAVSIHATGGTVTGVVRTPESADAIRAIGIEPWTTDLDRDDATLPAGPFDVVFHMAPPPRTGDTDPRTARLLTRLPPCSRLVYLSTTGVYGDRGGEWVDEDSVPAPTSARGRRRLDAESRLRAWCEGNGVEWVILRVAAIHGRGRTVSATGPDSGGTVWVNRIDADDLARVCVAAATSATAGTVYDCADGEPVRHRPGDRGFSESKRVRGRRMRELMGNEPAA